jgi:hypothetical protein
LKRDDLVAALSGAFPPALANDLVDTFLQIRQDVLTQTLGHSSPGKFVETFVQILQFLDAGKYDTSPAVDEFLRKFDSQASSVPDGLRVCGVRLARAMYALRSKRNVVHKGELDPSGFDLRLLHQGAQWIVAELLRTVSGLQMAEAGAFVEMVQAPAGGLVEDFGGKKLVTKTLSSREEALILLHSEYPAPMPLTRLVKSMDRFDPSTVRKTTRLLWNEKSVEGEAKSGYALTGKGFAAAIEVIQQHL